MTRRRLPPQPAEPLKVYWKSVYGVPRCYPLNEPAALMLELTGKRTFNRADIRRLRDLGHEVVAVPHDDLAQYFP